MLRSVKLVLFLSAGTCIIERTRVVLKTVIAGVRVGWSKLESSFKFAREKKRFNTVVTATYTVIFSYTIRRRIVTLSTCKHQQTSWGSGEVECTGHNL